MYLHTEDNRAVELQLKFNQVCRAYNLDPMKLKFGISEVLDPQCRLILKGCEVGQPEASADFKSLFAKIGIEALPENPQLPNSAVQYGIKGTASELYAILAKALETSPSRRANKRY